jgi:hypothetical protein
MWKMQRLNSQCYEIWTSWWLCAPITNKNKWAYIWSESKVAAARTCSLCLSLPNILCIVCPIQIHFRMTYNFINVDTMNRSRCPCIPCSRNTVLLFRVACRSLRWMDLMPTSCKQVSTKRSQLAMQNTKTIQRGRVRLAMLVLLVTSVLSGPHFHLGVSLQSNEAGTATPYAANYLSLLILHAVTY